MSRVIFFEETGDSRTVSKACRGACDLRDSILVQTEDAILLAQKDHAENVEAPVKKLADVAREARLTKSLSKHTMKV